MSNSDYTINQISSYIKISGILWMIIGALQIFFFSFLWFFGFLWIALGVWNLIAGYSRIQLAPRILDRETQIPEEFESITELVVIGVANLLLGSIFGVMVVIFDFVIRDKILKNRDLFNANPSSSKRGNHWTLSGFDSLGNVVRLEFSTQGHSGRVFVIGRNPTDCDLVISDQGVSRRHAEISIIDNNVFIQDLGSSNGTRLNGQRLSKDRKVSLPPQGTLALGSVELAIVAS